MPTLARTCADFRRAAALRRHIDAGAADYADEQVSLLMQRYYRSADALADMAPATLAELVDKAEALRSFIVDDVADLDDDLLPRIARSLADDITRLIGLEAQ